MAAETTEHAGVFRLHQARPLDAARPDGVRRRISRHGLRTPSGSSTARTKTCFGRDVCFPVRLTSGDGRSSVLIHRYSDFPGRAILVGLIWYGFNDLVDLFCSDCRNTAPHPVASGTGRGRHRPAHLSSTRDCSRGCCRTDGTGDDTRCRDSTSENKTNPQASIILTAAFSRPFVTVGPVRIPRK